MADDPRLVTGDWTTLAGDAGAVRKTVFVEEQGIAEELEWDPADAVSLHAVLYLGGRPVATGRLLPDAHIGRMAVLAALRGGGFGGRILRALMAAAAQRGDRAVMLSAQTHAVPFYTRHGFVAEGPVYDEVGIPHQAMRRAIDPGEFR
jgi:predicted GNAT family N-acyltransferase